MSSKRLIPTQTSRSTSGDQGSPATARLRAIEHVIWEKSVRCMGRAYISSLRELTVLPCRMELPPIVSKEEWQRAHEALLAKEKEATRARDALAAERRRQPRLEFSDRLRVRGARTAGSRSSTSSRAAAS